MPPIPRARRAPTRLDEEAERPPGCGRRAAGAPRALHPRPRRRRARPGRPAAAPPRGRRPRCAREVRLRGGRARRAAPQRVARSGWRAVGRGDSIRSATAQAGAEPLLLRGECRLHRDALCLARGGQLNAAGCWSGRARRPTREGSERPHGSSDCASPQRRRPTSPPASGARPARRTCRQRDHGALPAACLPAARVLRPARRMPCAADAPPRAAGSCERLAVDVAAIFEPATATRAPHGCADTWRESRPADGRTAARPFAVRPTGSAHRKSETENMLRNVQGFSRAGLRRPQTARIDAAATEPQRQQQRRHAAAATRGCRSPPSAARPPSRTGRLRWTWPARWPHHTCHSARALSPRRASCVAAR